MRGWRRDFDTLQNMWQTQEFVRLAEKLAGAVGLKRVHNDAFYVADTWTMYFMRLMFEASGAESVNRRFTVKLCSLHTSIY